MTRSSTELSDPAPNPAALLALALLIVVAPVALVGWLCFLLWAIVRIAAQV